MSEKPPLAPTKATHPKLWMATLMLKSERSRAECWLSGRIGMIGSSMIYSLLAIISGTLAAVSGFEHQWVVWAPSCLISGVCWWLGRRLLQA